MRRMYRSFQRWLDGVAPVDPYQERTGLDRIGGLPDLHAPVGEVGDIQALRNGLGGSQGPHDRDDRWLSLGTGENR